MEKRKEKVADEIENRRKQDDYQRRHEIALLKILVRKMPDEARKIFKEMLAEMV